MRKSRFSEAQVAEILKEGESGVPISDLIRKHGIRIWKLRTQSSSRCMQTWHLRTPRSRMC